MTNRELRYGLVGAGAIAELKHLKGYLGQPGVEAVAICNHRPDRAAELARKYGVPKVYADYRKMFDEADLDLISICTPNHTHLPIAVAALEKGIHVHCEKPIALNAGEAERMIAARDHSGKQLMIGLNNRFTGSAYFAKRYIAAGHLGEIYHLRCGWRRRRQIPGKGSWFTIKALAGGGPLIDLGVHYIDLALYLSGFPKAESVSAATYSKFADNRCLNSWTYGDGGNGAMDVEDLAVGLVRMENGATLDFEFGWASNVERESQFYELLGTRGGLSFREGQLKIYSEIEETLVDMVPDTAYGKEPLNEFAHFIDCIRENRKPLAGPEQARDVMKIIDAAYRSAETGREAAIE